MPIVTELGIYTAELCENSKKYLSHLLIGKTGIKPDFLTWDLLLTEKFNLSPIHPLQVSKQEIINELIKIETQHAEEYLKLYDPEFRKQQEDLRQKKLALISITIVISLVIAFPCALPLLGGVATLVGVLCWSIGAALICCSIIPAFCGERLIDPEWLKEYSIEKEKIQQKITTIKATSEIAVINAETEEPIGHKSTNIQPDKPTELNQPKPLTAKSAIQTNTVIYRLFSLAKKNKLIFNKQIRQSNSVPLIQVCGFTNSNTRCMD